MKTRNTMFKTFFGTILTLVTTLIFMGFTSVDKQDLLFQNIIKNGGFENGKASWTFTAGTMTIQNTTLISGLWTAKFDATAQNDYMQQSIALPAAGDLAGQNCAITFKYNYTDTAQNLTLALTDGSNTIYSKLLPLTVGTNIQAYVDNFICPTSGTLVVKVYQSTATNAAPFYSDLWLAGDANRINLGSVAHMTDETSYTPTFTGIGTVSNVQVVYYGIGDRLYVRGRVQAGTVAASTFSMTLPAGLTINTALVPTIASGVGNIVRTSSGVQIGYVLVDSSTSTSIVYGGIQSSALGGLASANGNTIASNSDNVTFSFDVPILQWAGSQQVASVNTTPAYYSGYHSAGCSWVSIDTSKKIPVGDATSCSLNQIDAQNITVSSVSDGTGVQPRLSMQMNKTGKIEVCVDVSWYHADTGQVGIVSLSDDDNSTNYSEANTRVGTAGASGSSYLCIQKTMPDISAHVVSLKLSSASNDGSMRINDALNVITYWTVKDISQNITQPVLVPQTRRATLHCAASSSITSYSGSAWLTSLGNISTGVCAGVINSGVFSTTPRCNCSDASVTLDSGAKGSASSTTAFLIVGIKPSDGSALSSFDCNLECAE